MQLQHTCFKSGQTMVAHQRRVSSLRHDRHLLKDRRQIQHHLGRGGQLLQSIASQRESGKRDWPEDFEQRCAPPDAGRDGGDDQVRQRLCSGLMVKDNFCSLFL